MFPPITRRFILFACFAALIESANANAQQATELIQTLTFDVDAVQVHRDERYDRIHYRRVKRSPAECIGTGFGGRAAPLRSESCS